MPSTFSPNLRIELIGAGEQAGTWNLTNNKNLGSILEQAITGVGTIDLSGGDRVLLTLNAEVDEARNATLVFYGFSSEPVNVVVPGSPKQYEIHNKLEDEVVIKVENYTGEYVCPPESTSWITIAPGSDEVLGKSITEGVAEALKRKDFSGMREEMGAAPIESPEFKGEPTAPTPPDGDNSDRIATTEYVTRNGVPKGAILMWSGAVAEIPDGWALCDGKNGTPDLQGKFVLGVGARHNIGTSGGSEDAVVVSHNHGGATGSQNRNHTHTGNTSSAGAHTHEYELTRAFDESRGGANYIGWGQNWGNRWLSGKIRSAGAHTHSFTTGANSVNHEHSIPSAGVDGKGKNMPPYYVLAYIMKVAG